jgi:hypothetical protein
VQIVVGEVRAEVGAVAEDRAVLHEAVAKEGPLAVADVLVGEEGPAGGVDDPLGDRRVTRVGAVGEQAEDEEPAQEDDDRRLKPTFGNDQGALLGLQGSSSLASLPQRRRF